MAPRGRSPARLVRRTSPRPAVAAHARPVRSAGLGGDAPADPGRARDSPVRDLARALAVGRRPCGCTGGRRDPGVARARLQPQSRQSASRRAADRRAGLAGRPDRASGRRPLHRRRGPELRPRRGGASDRHQRSPRAGANRPPLRLAVRTGSDGSGRASLPRARPALRCLPACRWLSVTRPALRAFATAEPA